MKVLLTGANGQLGWELQRAKPASVELTALGRDGLDISHREAVVQLLRDLEPAVVINAAAYNQVDRAESESERAFETNAKAPRILAEAAKNCAARLIHVSTDFVFYGERSVPWLPGDAAEPVSVYGRSKLAGEQAVAAAHGAGSAIVRTAWLYSSHGENFVRKMLTLMRTRERITVVSDQLGTPTWAAGLADVLWEFARRQDLRGLFHWSDDGVASRHDFAVAIQEGALERGLLTRRIPVDAIGGAEYPAAAERPGYSVLDKRATIAAIGKTPDHWRHNLGCMLDELTSS